LVIHGGEDQIMPIDAAGRLGENRQERAADRLSGHAHRLTDTHKDKFDADLLAFAKA
jgi:non-heme chloroperoxidase